MQFWGFKRPMGRLWTVLYLSPEPLGAAELGERVHMSSGAVSMTLSELTKWGAVRKTWRPGERRDFYEAETSIGKLVLRVLKERELTLIGEFSATLADARHALDHGSDDPELAHFKRERLGRLCELAEVGERLLRALVAGDTVDPTPILEASGK
jgi:DNA-binding transcriptional regulator GbsR (MarR family)